MEWFDLLVDQVPDEVRSCDDVGDAEGADGSILGLD